MDQTCLRCRQLISAAIDGEATQNELAFIQQHLVTCPDCREAQEAYQTIRYRFQNLNQPLPPPQLRMAVMAQLGSQSQGRSMVLGRRRVSGLQPLLTFGQKLTVGAIAGLVLVLGSVIIWGILRTPPFEMIDQQANLAEQKVVLTFSQPVDQTYIMNHADLFEVKDQLGNLLPIATQNIKIQDDGKKVELTLPDGVIAPGATDVQLDVKPDLKSNDGKKLNNPGPKEATVISPVRLDTTRPSTPRPSQPTVKATPTRAAPSPTPVRTTRAADPTTVVDDTPIPAATSTAMPAAKPTPTKPVTTTPVSRPTTTPSLTVTPTVTISTTVSPQPTGGSTTPTVTPVISGTVTPTDISPPAITTGPTTVAPTTPSATTAASVTTVAPTTSLADTCKVGLRRDFELLYNNRADIANKIGCPLVEEAPAGFVYQPFQHGFMLQHRQTGLIYIFYSSGAGTGTWVRMRDPGTATLPPATTAAPGTTPAPPVTPTPLNGCSLSPEHSFDNIWSNQPTVRNALGCPLATESQIDLGAYQPFDKGLMFFSPSAVNGRRVYVLYNDATYLDLPDAFQG